MPTIQNIIDTETGLKKLLKRVPTTRLYDIELDSDSIRSGDTIASVTSLTPVSLGKVTGSTLITVTGITHNSARKIQFTGGAGTVGEKYRLDFVVTMTSGDILADSVLLEVN